MRVSKAQIPRLRMIFNLETLGDRSRMFANAFASQLCNIQDDDTATERQKVQARNTQKALETSISFGGLVARATVPEGKEQLLRRKETKREGIWGLMRRPIPRMKPLHPALRMRSATDRALGCRWHLGTFPSRYRFLCSIGLKNYLHDLKLLTKKKTSPFESARLRIARRVISSISELEHPTADQD